MTLNLFLLRHGETESSFSGGYCGLTDIALTPEGREMADDFAAAYQDHPWAGIYVSPLLRTRTTAEPLCRLTGHSMQLRPELREIEYGAWEGKSAQQVAADHPRDYQRWLSDAGWNAPTGGERGIDVARRVLLVLDEIQQTHAEGDVLVVSHKATIRILICSLLGIDLGAYRDRIDTPVASLSVVEFHEHGPRLARLGDRSHLRPALRDRSGT